MALIIETDNQTELALERKFRRMLKPYMDKLELTFPGKIGGAYVIGSAALGGYNPRTSDLDLAVVLNSMMSNAEIDRLDNLHADIKRDMPALKLEVHYFQWRDLGRDRKDIIPHPYYKYDSLSRAERAHFNPNVWWFMKYHSITLTGPCGEDLPFDIQWETVRVWNKRFLNNFWTKWTRDIGTLLTLKKDEVVNWVVLSVCRLHYNLYERELTTKEQAGYYALEFLPQKHHRIVHEALRIRAGRTERLYRSKIRRGYDAVRLINYIVKQCKENVRLEG